MADEAKLVGVDHVGGGPSGSQWSERHRLRFVFHDFAGMSHPRGVGVQSSTMECHGYEWSLMLCPWGDQQSSSEDFISAFLYCESAKKSGCDDHFPDNVETNFIFRVPSENGVPVSSDFRHSFWRETVKEGCQNYGTHNLVSRSKILNPANNFLVDGALTIEVDIQVAIDKPFSWKPTNTVCSDMLKMLEEAANDPLSDVIFEVGKGRTVKGGKDLKLQFHAHKNILTHRSPVLSALTEDYDNGTPIPIEDENPVVFRMLLRFVYGGEIPDKKSLQEYARTLISAADRFGCTCLKLAVEADLAAAGITVDNAADLILFADGTNCAMLKEAAVDFFVENSDAVMQSVGYEKVKESPAILSELLTAFSRSKERNPSADPVARDFNLMQVATLRRNLDDRGLDVDGSKKMLVSRLEDAVAQEAAAAAAEAQAAEDASGSDDE